MKICENVYWYREKGWMDANTFVIKGDITVLIDPGLSEYAWMKCKEMREDGIRDQPRSRGLGDVYKRQLLKP